MEEIWKDIAGFPDYQISTKGRVKSFKRDKTNGRFKKAHTSKSNCIKIQLFDINIKRFTFEVHRLVATAFIPNPKNKREVNHLDGDRTNNTLVNLEGNTHKEIMEHARRTGLMSSNENHYCAKFTNAQVRLIRKLNKLDSKAFSRKHLSYIYKVDRSTIANIINRKYYRNI